MKTITLYECEICGSRYTTPKSASDCEITRGKPKEYPIGMIFGHHCDKKDFYGEITFAVASNRLERHANWGSMWACRDTGAGDSLGSEHCGGNNLKLGPYDSQIDHTSPHFKRMVEWQQKRGMQVMVWNGIKPVPLDEWLASPEADNYKKPAMYNP